MYKSHRVLAVAVTFTMLCLGGSTAFAGELSAPRDLKDKKCKDIMILSGEDRESRLHLLMVTGWGRRTPPSTYQKYLARPPTTLWTIALITRATML